MSAIARYCKTKGLKVSGYDRTPSELTRSLESEGIEVHYNDDSSKIPPQREDTLVVYTPAVPCDFGELEYARSEGYKVVKRSQMLGEITSGETLIAVSGTHGKTTTSTMIAHILTESGLGCSAFLGGISKNYDTNMLVNPSSPLVVAEADEFDRSFLQLHPATAIITAMDADHLDIYGDLEHVQEAFREFASQVSDTLIVKKGLPISERDSAAKIFSYHFDDPASDFHSCNLRLGEDGHYTYDLVYPGGVLSDIRVGAIGRVNVENSIAAAAASLCCGLDAQKVKAAISTFLGVKRRLDVHLNTPKVCYIDDYAHHPAELESAIGSVRDIFPGRHICGIFQPHLYTRTRDFASGFASALSKLDELILLDIYPAREDPIEGVSSEIIFKGVTCAKKTLLRYEELMPYLKEHRSETDVLLTLGAGNIDRFVEPVTELLSPAAE